MDEFAPQCMKCGSRHFFSQGCPDILRQGQAATTEIKDRLAPVKGTLDAQAYANFEGTCTSCQIKDRLIESLQDQLREQNGDAVRGAKRREYQREYMRKYRENVS